MRTEVRQRIQKVAPNTIRSYFFQQMNSENEVASGNKFTPFITYFLRHLIFGYVLKNEDTTYE